MKNTENWANKEFVLEAVRKNGSALEYASKELRGDKEVVLEAVKQDGLALNYAREELRNDKEVFEKAMLQNWEAIRDFFAKVKKLEFQANKK
jgi:hypothetical protein